MSSPVSRGAIIRALLKKELISYSRDTIYLALTGLVLVMVPVVFWLMPDTVDESITLAVSPPVSELVADARGTLEGLGATPEQLAALDEADLTEGEAGLALIEFDSAEDMAAVIGGTLEAYRSRGGEIVLHDKETGEKRPEGAERLRPQVGIAFPPSFIGDVATSKGDVTVTVYSDAAVDPEIRSAMRSFVREMAYQFAGVELPVGLPAEESMVLGDDRLGNQVTPREQLRPMLAFMLLLMETFSIASLISVEIAQRTVGALLVTPMRLADFLAAKAVFGTGVSVIQTVIILALIGSFTASNWSLMLALAVLGAMLFTGVAMVVGAAGKDFMGQIFYNMLFTVPLLIPAIAVLFPGSTAVWVTLIPTFPLMDALVSVTAYGAGWAETWPSLAASLAWVVVIFGAGLITLKRKVETL